MKKFREEEIREFFTDPVRFFRKVKEVGKKPSSGKNSPLIPERRDAESPFFSNLGSDRRKMEKTEGAQDHLFSSFTEEKHSFKIENQSGDSETMSTFDFKKWKSTTQDIIHGSLFRSEGKEGRKEQVEGNKKSQKSQNGQTYQDRRVSQDERAEDRKASQTELYEGEDETDLIAKLTEVGSYLRLSGDFTRERQLDRDETRSGVSDINTEISTKLDNAFKILTTPSDKHLFSKLSSGILQSLLLTPNNLDEEDKEADPEREVRSLLIEERDPSRFADKEESGSLRLMTKNSYGGMFDDIEED